jgi:hypothetical protein
MTVTSATKKTTTALVGEVWDLSAKVTPAPSAEVEHPVTFTVSTPTGVRTVVAVLADGVWEAPFVLDTPGEFTATAVSVGEQGAEPQTLDGLKATAKARDDEPTPTSEPDTAPVDA